MELFKYFGEIFSSNCFFVIILFINFVWFLILVGIIFLSNFICEDLINGLE